jgi:hypothetical protein
MNRQDRRAKRSAMDIELLEGRRVLSTATDAVVPVTLATDVATPTSAQGDPILYATSAETTVPTTASLVRGVSYLYLQGSAHGSTSTVVGNPDVGTTLKLQGKGQVHGLGSVKVSGSLHGTGFIAGSQGITGDLQLSNGKGSVTLHLQGPPVKGFTPPGSGTYSFTIKGGTGAYKHDIGNGSVDLVLGAKSFTLSFHGKPNVY